MRMFTRIAALALGAMLLLGTALSPAKAYDRTMRIFNNSSYTVYHFYAANRDAQYWSGDILGEDVLQPGEYTDVDFDDGSGYCIFDLKATGKGGSPVWNKRINVCEQSYWTLVN